MCLVPNLNMGALTSKNCPHACYVMLPLPTMEGECNLVVTSLKLSDLRVGDNTVPGNIPVPFPILHVQGFRLVLALLLKTSCII